MNDLAENHQGDNSFINSLVDEIQKIVAQIKAGNNYMDLSRKAIEIFEIWKDQDLFLAQRLDEWIETIKNSKSYEMLILKDLPEGLPPVPTELMKLAENQQKRKQYFDKYTETSDSKNKKENYENYLKYQHLTLRSEKDLLLLLDKQHIRDVMELKLLIQKLGQLKGLLD